MQRLPIAKAFMVILLSLSGCTAPIQTQMGIGSTPSGMAYFLPQRDLLIHYSTSLEDDQCHESLEIATSEPYADPTAGFMANIAPLFMGDNNSTLVVTPEGLLHSAVSESNPAFREILLSASASITELMNQRVSMDREQAFPDECVERDFHWTVTLPIQQETLGNYLSVQKQDSGYVFRFEQEWTRWSFTLERPKIAVVDPKPKPSVARGLFYRVNIPYRLRFDSELTRRLNTNGAVVFLPNESPRLLAPAPGSVFGKKEAAMTFDRGILVSYGAKFEGDGKQVAKLPVEMLGAVTAATGNVFRGRKDRSEQELAALNAELRLERLRQEQAACVAALQQRDDEKIDSECNF